MTTTTPLLLLLLLSIVLLACHGWNIARTGDRIRVKRADDAAALAQLPPLSDCTPNMLAYAMSAGVSLGVILCVQLVFLMFIKNAHVLYVSESDETDTTINKTGQKPGAPAVAPAVQKQEAPNELEFDEMGNPVQEAGAPAAADDGQPMASPSDKVAGPGAEQTMMDATASLAPATLIHKNTTKDGGDETML